MIRVIKVIETDLETRGQGVPPDPVRRIRQYYTLDGTLLAEHDPIDEPTEDWVSEYRRRIERTRAAGMHRTAAAMQRALDQTLAEMDKG